MCKFVCFSVQVVILYFMRSGAGEGFTSFGECLKTSVKFLYSLVTINLFLEYFIKCSSEVLYEFHLYTNNMYCL